MQGAGSLCGVLPAFATPRCATWASVTLERKVMTHLQTLTCVFAYDSHLLGPVESGRFVGWFLFHTATCPVSLLRDCLEGVCGPVTPRPGKGPVRGVTVGPTGGRSGLGLAVSGKTIVTHGAG